MAMSLASITLNLIEAQKLINAGNVAEGLALAQRVKNAMPERKSHPNDKRMYDLWIEQRQPVLVKG